MVVLITTKVYHYCDHRLCVVYHSMYVRCLNGVCQCAEFLFANFLITFLLYENYPLFISAVCSMNLTMNLNLYQLPGSLSVDNSFNYD